MACRYDYAAKLICGSLDDPERGAPGVYKTTINIHNPWQNRVFFRKKLALTFPRRQPRSSEPPRIAEEMPGNVIRIEERPFLDADEAMALDCVEFSELVPGAAFFEGFVVIQSPASLDVTAVYTVTGRDRTQPSIDVEQIPERVRELLTSSLQGLAQDEEVTPEEA
jgi:hypothetical protein